MSNKEWERVYSLLLKLNITDEHKEIARHIKDIANTSIDIIDIGCGAGEYSICFSKLFDSVFALDISISLIDNLKAKNQDKISCISMDYKDYKKTHDVSFISFCPVIQKKEDLQQIIKNTKDYVFILTVDKGSIDYHRFHLMKLLPPMEKKGFIKNADWFKDTLTSLNISYKEEKYSSSWEESKSTQEAIEYFTTYFMALGYQKDDVYPTISTYIEENSTNGVLIEQHILNKSLLYFKKQ